MVYSSYSFEYHVRSFHYESYQNTKIPKFVVCEAGTSGYKRLWVHIGLRSKGRKGNEPLGRSWVWWHTPVNLELRRGGRKLGSSYQLVILLRPRLKIN